MDRRHASIWDQYVRSNLGSRPAGSEDAATWRDARRSLKPTFQALMAAQEDAQATARKPKPRRPQPTAMDRYTQARGQRTGRYEPRPMPGTPAQRRAVGNVGAGIPSAESFWASARPFGAFGMGPPASGNGAQARIPWSQFGSPMPGDLSPWGMPGDLSPWGAPRMDMGAFRNAGAGGGVALSPMGSWYGNRGGRFNRNGSYLRSKMDRPLTGTTSPSTSGNVHQGRTHKLFAARRSR